MVTVLAALAALAFVAVLAVILIVSAGSPKSGGSMTTTMLGAQDIFMTNDRKLAAEVIVEQKAEKKLMEQESSEPFDTNSSVNDNIDS